jgi:hypothetical protein
VEAPFVWEENGKFHLFYSANTFDSYSYAIGHAVADSPLGPFTKSEDPVVASNGGCGARTLRAGKQGREGLDALPRVAARCGGQ